MNSRFRTIGLIVFAALILPHEGLTQDTCFAFCDSLNLTILVDSSAGCEISFAYEVEDSLTQYADTSAIYHWIIDDDTLSSESLVLSFEEIQNGEILFLEAEVAVSDSVTCLCTESFDLQSFTEMYDWPCECQPEGEPVAAFDVFGEGQCGDLPILFDNQSTGFGLDFEWSFGTGGVYGISELSSPEVPIIIDGGGTAIVPVTLTVTDANGCQAQMTQQIEVLQVPNPGLQEVTALCLSDLTWPNYPVTLIPMPFGFSGIESISIDWGNGTDTIFSPLTPFFDVLSTPYDAFGDYIVTVNAIGNNGCTSEFSGELFVGNNPQIGTANPGNTDGLCSPHELVFPISNFESNAIGTEYTIDFGDGTPVEIYQHPPPDFVSHFYSITSCGETTPLGSYNAFLFEIEASNDCGVSNAAIDPIRVHQAPDPVVNGPDPVCVDVWNNYTISGNGVEVDDCNDPDCCIENSGYWTIAPIQGQGMANPSSAALTLSVNVMFPDPGLYGISYYEPHLYCPDGYATKEVCVYPDLDPQFSFTTDQSCFPMEVQLSDITPALPCGEPAINWSIQGGAYSWGSGSSSTMENPTVILEESGVYTIELSHSIPGSKWVQCGTFTETAQIQVNGPPTIEVSSDIAICENSSILAQITNANDGGEPIENITWSIDGEFLASGGYEQLIDFDDFGSYQIGVEVANICGSDSELINVQIQPNPDLSWQAVPDDGVCSGDEVNLIGFGADALQWSITSEDPIWSSSQSSIQLNPIQSIVGTLTGTNTYGSLQCTSSINVN